MPDTDVFFYTPPDPNRRFTVELQPGDIVIRPGSSLNGRAYNKVFFVSHHDGELIPMVDASDGYEEAIFEAAMRVPPEEIVA